MVTVASLLQIIDWVGLLDSSRDLQLIRTKKFINRLYLVLHAFVQIFNVMFLDVKNWDLNKTLILTFWHLTERDPTMDDVSPINIWLNNASRTSLSLSLHVDPN